MQAGAVTVVLRSFHPSPPSYTQQTKDKILHSPTISKPKQQTGLNQGPAAGSTSLTDAEHIFLLLAGRSVGQIKNAEGTKRVG